MYMGNLLSNMSREERGNLYKPRVFFDFEQRRVRLSNLESLEGQPLMFDFNIKHQTMSMRVVDMDEYDGVEEFEIIPHRLTPGHSVGFLYITGNMAEVLCQIVEQFELPVTISSFFAKFDGEKYVLSIV